MTDYRVIRLAMSDYISAGKASEAYKGIELSDAKITATGSQAKTEVGNARLSADAIRYNLINNICVDYSGNIYGVCASRNCIVKIEEGGGNVYEDAGGTRGPVWGVNWYAGSQTGAAGNNTNLNNIDAVNARFNSPWGIACDKSGTLYVTDSGNQQIRTIKNGKVGILAGSAGLAGFVDGEGADITTDHAGLDARFNTPEGICVDKSGDVFVADTGNHAIRKIKSNGKVVTVAGNGSAGNAVVTSLNPSEEATWPSRRSCLSSPSAIACDASGNVYIIDYGNNVIKVLRPNGTLFRFSGGGGVGRSLGVSLIGTTVVSKADTCTYTAMYDIVAEASGNNVYVLDYMATGGRLLKLDKDGVPSEIADWNGNSYHGPWGVAVSPAQKLFVINYVV